MTYKIAFYILLCILIVFSVFGWDKESVISPDKEIDSALNLSFNHLKNNSSLSTGINYITGELSVVNNLTGEEVKPCKGGSFIDHVDIKQSSLIKNKARDMDCSVKILNPVPELRAVINASNSVIDGFVSINGKSVKAKFVVIVSTIYEGSECTTIGSNQNQYTLCLKEGRRCEILYNRAKSRAQGENPGMTEDEINQLILPDLEKARCAER